MKLHFFVTMLCCTLINIVSSSDTSLCLYNIYIEQPITLPTKSIVESILKQHFILLDEDNRYSFLSEQLAYRHVNDVAELLSVLETIILPWIVPIHQKITLEVIDTFVQQSAHSEIIEDEQDDADDLSEIQSLQISPHKHVSGRVARKRRRIHFSSSDSE
ncbi:hypothetical protein KBD08_02940 [Candidatus Babeliales bacterium]|nr:hypothetical protein [Candidatus Babeliales bacterium]